MCVCCAPRRERRQRRVPSPPPPIRPAVRGGLATRAGRGPVVTREYVATGGGGRHDDGGRRRAPRVSRTAGQASVLDRHPYGPSAGDAVYKRASGRETVACQSAGSARHLHDVSEPDDRRVDVASTALPVGNVVEVTRGADDRPATGARLFRRGSQRRRPDRFRCRALSACRRGGDIGRVPLRKRFPRVDPSVFYARAASSRTRLFGVTTYQWQIMVCVKSNHFVDRVNRHVQWRRTL